MKKEIKKNNSGVATVFALGASLASLAASAYFFLGPEAKKNQKYAKAWAIKMKGDVIGKLETAKEVSEPIYHKIIDTVAAKHEKIIKNGPKEVKELAKDLKKHWSTISEIVKTKPVAPKLVAKKIVKKVTKKK